MITRAKPRLGAAILMAAIAAAGATSAADKKPAPEKLPGVEGNYRIVRPYAPEPEPDQAPIAKIDGWDVRISGQLTIDVVTGGLPLPRH